MSLRVAFGCLCLSIFALGCTVQTGTGVNDASSTDRPVRTKATPRKKPSPTTTTTDPNRPARTPASPVRR